MHRYGALRPTQTLRLVAALYWAATRVLATAAVRGLTRR